MKKHIEINPASEDGLRWIENIGTAWRFAGFADDIVNLRHNGWFTDEFQDETFRGVVYRLPSHKGKPIYFVGYADPNNDDCARGEIRTDLDDDNEAAYAADAIAERCAESEREYQEAWQLGQRYASTLETVEQERRERSLLFIELRQIKDSIHDAKTPTLCKVLKDRIARTRRNIRDAYAERRSIIADSYLRGDLMDAFADGAGITAKEASQLF